MTNLTIIRSSHTAGNETHLDTFPIAHIDAAHQRLPEECLSLVFKHLHDIPTLRSLIHVGRFSFYTALPLLVDAYMGISLYDLLRISPLSVDMQEYDLAILVLVSILHYHRRRSYSPDLSASMFLLRHNLLLVEPVTSQLVLDFLQGGL